LKINCYKISSVGVSSSSFKPASIWSVLWSRVSSFCNGIYLFATAFTYVLICAQPHVELYPGPLSLGAQRPKGSLTTHFHLIPKFRCMDICLHDPVRLYGVRLWRGENFIFYLYSYTQ